jgi:hypothetical protein
MCVCVCVCVCVCARVCMYVNPNFMKQVGEYVLTATLRCAQESNVIPAQPVSFAVELGLFCYGNKIFTCMYRVLLLYN